ncbi:hypothetical protein SYNPS1DRAFT_8317, partial [Syncephalis pseudoplumigaleata]
SRRSGLQCRVLAMYRACMRAVATKPVEAQPRFRAFVRSQFRRDDVKKTDVAAIEHLLRSGERLLETYKQPNVQDIR